MNTLGMISAPIFTRSSHPRRKRSAVRRWPGWLLKLPLLSVGADDHIGPLLRTAGGAPVCLHVVPSATDRVRADISVGPYRTSINPWTAGGDRAPPLQILRDDRRTRVPAVLPNQSSPGVITPGELFPLLQRWMAGNSFCMALLRPRAAESSQKAAMPKAACIRLEGMPTAAPRREPVRMPSKTQ